MTETLGSYFVERKERGRPGLPVYSVTLENGLVPRDTLDRRTESGLDDEAHALVERGDIAYNMMRMWQGALGVSEQPCLVSPAYVVMRPKNNVDVRFAAAWMKSDRGVDRLWAYSHGITYDRLRLYADDFLAIPVSFPPLVEQRRIAAVLDTWDRAITDANRLAKLLKRASNNLRATLIEANRKQALTQMAAVSFSGVDKHIVEGEKAVRLCNYMDVLRNRRIADDLPFSKGSATAGEATRFALQRDDVVFTKDSETAEEIAEAAYVADDLTNVVCGYHLGIARPLLGYSGAYISHAMRVPRIRQQFVVRANGAVRFGLTLETLDHILLPAPSLDRQLAIAAALDAAEDESAMHEFTAELLLRQKRGLMQKLLTGEWRVPATGDAFAPGGPTVQRLEAAE